MLKTCPAQVQQFVLETFLSRDWTDDAYVSTVPPEFICEALLPALVSWTVFKCAQALYADLYLTVRLSFAIVYLCLPLCPCCPTQHSNVKFLQNLYI